MKGGGSEHDPDHDHHHDHAQVVAAWFRRTAQNRSASSLVHAIEDAFGALWQRSVVTLGEVTLTAIVGRVLHSAAEQFALLEAAKIDVSGLRLAAVASLPDLHVDQVYAAFELLFVEFLTVLGNLTDQILTPALHTTLSGGRVAPLNRGTNEDV
jgi:hypothetical protein